MPAEHGATYIPELLDGSLHTPRSTDAYVHVRIPDPPSERGSVTAYLPSGTALIVPVDDVIRLARAGGAKHTRRDP